MYSLFDLFSTGRKAKQRDIRSIKETPFKERTKLVSPKRRRLEEENSVFGGGGSLRRRWRWRRRRAAGAKEAKEDGEQCLEVVTAVRASVLLFCT